MEGTFTVPLSYGQERIWLLDRLSAGSALYTIPATLRLTSRIDTGVLSRSLHEIVRRHESLRTSFPMRNGAPAQLVSQQCRCELGTFNLEHLPVAEREAAARRIAAEEARRPFDLETGPMFRPTLITIAPDQNLLLLTFHHIVADGWSLGVFFRELSAIYPAFLGGLQSPLADLPIQFPDYAVWQRQWLESGVMRKQLDYWRSKLSALPALALPIDRAWSISPGLHGASQATTIGPDLSERVTAASQREGVTLFMFLLAAFQVLLYRYTGQEDFAVGSPVANRGRAETEGLIGFFVNTLVLRTSLAGNPTFRELLQRVREVTLEAFAHQDTPFECLVEELQPVRDPGRNPLVQVLFSLQNTALAQQPKDIIGTGWDTDRGTGNFDLAVDLWSAASGIECRWEYRTDLFDEASINRLMEHYRNLIEAAASNLDERVARLPLLSEVERDWLLRGETAATWEQPATVWRCFSQQASKTPDATAVLVANNSLTYRELEEQSNRLARYLQKRVSELDLVVIALPPGLFLPVALLGVLKTGAAYLPLQLDPGTVVERSRFVLYDSGANLVLTESSLKKCFEGRPTIEVDAEWPQIMSEIAEPITVEGVASDAAYVIYTSGSTGKPKGVVVPHRALVNHAFAIASRYELCPSDRVLQFAPFGFDVAAEEIFPTWVAGGAVVLAGRAGALSFVELRKMILSHGISVVNLPASYWQEWVNDLSRRTEPLPGCLRLVVSGSERVSAEHFRRWQQLAGPGVRWINAYGVTEATITATTYEPNQELHGSTVPIGRPIANVSAYVLDRYRQPVPIGVRGELYLGGACLADGYLHRPELTRKAYVPNPFRLDERLYRTGDVVRWRTDGNLEFAGRVDEQIKIAGYRIEPGEIEVALLEHPSVAEAAVGIVARNGAGGALVAWINSHEDLQNVREFVRSRLPRHMVPSTFVKLARLPRLPNGKVDRHALPAPSASDLCPEESVAPRTPAEYQIAALWAELLGLEKVGVTDSFFDLGGHSLLATQLLSRIRAALGHEIPLRAFFEAPTVEALAVAIASGASSQEKKELSIQPALGEDAAAQVALMSEDEVDQMLRELMAQQPIQEGSA